MTETTVAVRLSRSPVRYEIRIGAGLLKHAGEWAGSSLERAGSAAIISNPKVWPLYGAVVERSLKRAGFRPHVHLIGDGERFKSLRTLERTLQFLSENKFSRTDTVVALGGGVVGDLAGFAASVYLRGISFLQIPTTLLSMIDSSVGGKTGVNTSFGKNLIGTFHQPSGVLIDTETLRTLDDRELTAGFCEAVKQGAISGKKLLGQTDRFLAEHRRTLGKGRPGFTGHIADLIAAQVRFKARIVQGDEMEAAGKIDGSSRKILNFGHTLAHALEKVTNYRRFKHGEAVGHGILFASRLSKKLELLSPDDVDLLNDVVHRAGVLPPLRNIEPGKVLEAFRYDKKTVGGSLQWVLLKGIGKPAIFPHQDIPPSVLAEAIEETLVS